MESEYTSRNRIIGFNFNTLYPLIRRLTNIVALVITTINLITYRYENSDTV